MLDQFYFAQCSPETSKTGKPDYTVRASTLSAEEIDTDLLAMLPGLVTYELPSQMEERLSDLNALDSLLPGKAPIRLARLRTKDDRMCIVQSVYRRIDDYGRPNTFFAHVLLPRPGDSPMSAGDAIQLWGSRGTWGCSDAMVWGEQGRGDPAALRDLPPWSATDGNHGVLSRDVITGFVAGTQVTVPADRPFVQVVPERLLEECDESQRRGVLEFVLGNFLGHRRIHLLAEPGFSALLIYLLTQTLPSRLTDDLTFSTYEPYHRAFTHLAADVVNTYMEPAAADKFLSDRTVDEGVVFDTYRFTRHGEAELPDSVESLVTFVVDAVEQGQFGMLDELWEKWSAVCGDAAKDTENLLQFWTEYRPLLRISEQPLTREQLDTYARHVSFRAHLFSTHEGRAQTVDQAVDQAPETLDWWPGSETESDVAEDFRTYKNEFHSLLIARAVTCLQDAAAESCVCAQHCLTVLLPLLLGKEFDEEDARRQIILGLEDAVGEGQLSATLPHATQELVTEWLRELQEKDDTFCDDPSRMDWMVATDYGMLVRLCDREDMPDRWKAHAILNALSGDLAEMDQVAQYLIDTPGLLEETIQLWPDFAARRHQAEPLLELLVSRVPSRRVIFNVCLALLKTGAVKPSQETTRSFEHAVDVLTGAASGSEEPPWTSEVTSSSAEELPWESFFSRGSDDADAVLELVGILGEDNPRTRSFWAACCRALNVKVLKSDDPQCQMYRVLRGKCPLFAGIQDYRDCQETMEHWHTIHASIKQPPPPGDARWDRLRWSMRFLDLREDDFSTISRLIRTFLDRAGADEGTVAEVVACAKVLLPVNFDRTKIARMLLQASKKVADANRSTVQKAILNALVGDCRACRDGITGTDRSADEESEQADVDTKRGWLRRIMKSNVIPLPVWAVALWAIGTLTLIAVLVVKLIPR